MKLKRNVGPYDRVFRVIIGGALLYSWLTGIVNGWIGTLLGIFGGTLLIEGTLGY